METTKPAYKTLKFWLLTVVTLIGLASASDLVNEGGQVQHILGWIVAVISTMFGVSTKPAAGDNV